MHLLTAIPLVPASAPAEVAHRLFYPEDSDGELTLEHFTRFVRLLQREALVMQFNQWDARGNGMLSAIDFAKFLVTKVC